MYVYIEIYLGSLGRSAIRPSELPERRSGNYTITRSGTLRRHATCIHADTQTHRHTHTLVPQRYSFMLYDVILYLLK